MGNCKIFRNNDGTINKVFDELGNESQLYYDTLFHVSTLVDKLPITPPIKSYLETGKIKDTSIPEVALGLWAYSYSDNFRNKYDIKVSKLEEVSIDDIIRHIEEYYPKSVVQETTTVEQPVIKEGVKELFNSNPELSTIGTQEQYSQYLDTIFPDSKVKDIVYRGGNLGIKQPQSVEAFTTSKSYAQYRAEQNNTQVYHAILNIKDSKLINKKETRTLSLDRDEIQYEDYGFTDNKDQTRQLGNFYTVKENNRHILGTKQDIEGFKEFVSSNVIPEQRLTDEMLNSIESINATENTIRDLAARMADRIGMSIRFESDRTKDYKGKIENDTAVINLANATLDTPIHEILGHPIIRAIKGNVFTPYFIYDVKDLSDDLNAKFKYEIHYSDDIDSYDVDFFNTEEELDVFIKNKTQPYSTREGKKLYQNLLKELETGRGKEVLDRIKRDYKYKDSFTEYAVYDFESEREAKKAGASFSTTTDDGEYIYIKQDEYSLTEQQEEAIVELLGLYTANRLDSVKDGKLISLLKRLLKEIKSFIRQLLNQKEVEIDKLPDNMTISDLANLLAYSNSKLILPGNEVIYTTPDNENFKTYAEASNHISELSKNIEEIDLNNVTIDNNDFFYEGKNYIKKDNKWFYERYLSYYKNYDVIPGYEKSEPLVRLNISKGLPINYSKDVISSFDLQNFKSNEDVQVHVENFIKNNPNAIVEKELQQIDLSNLHFNSYSKNTAAINIQGFIERNKEYEQSKKVIEEWMKVNNIVYNPEEVYSRGQEFVSVVGAYSDFDVNLMMQNLLQHIEDNEKAGGEFTISAFTKPIDKTIGHLEGNGGKIKFKMYPQPKDIKWASNTDVFSGSVWDASEKINKDKKSELLGVSYSKYPSIKNVNKIQPNLASIIDNREYHHNELGITLTSNNFRLEYDDDVPYSTKKIINSINKILDQKYGKLVKTEIKKQQQGKLVTKYIVESIDPDDTIKIKTFENEQDAIDYKDYMDTNYLYSEHNIRIEKLPLGIQPTQTKDTLVESIESIRDKILPTTNEREQDLDTLEVRDSTDSFEVDGKYFNITYYQIYNYGNSLILDELISKESSFDTEEEAENKIKELIEEAKKIYNERKSNQKEYTEQALINTKIARLKEVAKKYPRSLIRSEVKPIEQAKQSLSYFEDDLPFQKVPTYNPETKSKTELLEEFNHLVKISEMQGIKYPDDAIIKIKSFLQDLNFNLSTVDEILAKRGLKDNPKAVIDFAYNTIAFGDGATVEDFAEEIGHLIALHAPQDKNLDRALEAIKDTQLYKDNYLNYVKTYSKPGLALEMSPERKAALEVLGRFYGKMLTGTLTDKDLEISKQSFFKRIMNAIRRMINGNFNLRTYLERNRDNFFLEPGKEIKSKEIFYSLEENEKITYSKMTNAIEKMAKSLKSRMSRTYKDETAPLGEYSKRLSTLQTQLDQVYKMKENLAYDSAFADFLKSLYIDTTNVFTFLEKYFNFSKTPASVVLKDVKFSTQDKIFIGKDETNNSSVIENNDNAIIYTKFKLLNLKSDADLSTLHYSQLSELREFLVYYNNFIEEMGINNVKNSIINLDKLKDLNNLTSYVLDSLKDIETALSVLNSKKLPDTIDDLIEDTGVNTDIIPTEIMNALKSTNITNDVGMIEYLLGTTRDASQPILRLINAIVKNIMYIAKRNTLSFANPFLERLSHRIGQSMDWAYEKYNGKFTGYFISKHNYGEYYDEKNKFFKELNARYNYPEDYKARENVFSEIITKNNSINYYKDKITELKLKIFNESNEDLKLKYLDDIADTEITIEKIESDYAIYRQYRNESAEWFNENTEPLDNVEDIINELFNDTTITDSEKAVWLSNNTLKNDSGDIISYTNELVRPSDKYLNPNYKSLNSSQIADLEYIKQTKKDLDKYLPTKINNLAPQTYQSTIDTLMKTQLPELINKIKFLGKSTVVKQEDDEIGELTGDIVDYQDETRIIKYNPTRYTRRLLEPNNISTDLLSSMIAYAKMVYEFKEKGDRIEQLEFVAQNIKSGQTLNVKRQESESTSGKNIMKQLENYLRVQIMGISYPDVVIPGLNINVTKMLKNAARFVTAKNLGLNFATQFIDFATSKLWYNIEKVMGDTVTKKSSTLGYKAFKELAQDAVKESKSTIKNNKLSIILRTLGLSDNLYSVFNDLDKNILMRDVSNKVLFAGYRASNFFISGNAALSAMYNYRLYNGKWYTEKEFSKIQNPTEQFDSLPSAYDNMRVENGVMSVDGMNVNTFNLFSRRLNNLISKIDGKLSEEDKTYAHSTLIGIVTLIHRDWILDGISRRFKKKGFNFDTGANDEGYWRATGRFMIEFFADKEKIRNLKTLITKYNELDDSQKEGVRRTMYELLVVIGSIALAIIMNLGDDDDDRELDYLKDLAAYLSTRITMETTAFYNPFEYVYAVSDVFVISRDFKKIISFTEMFNAKEVESGKWEGWTRSQKYFLQNVPGVTGAISLSNPEASNRFIINNVLGFAGGFDKFSYFSVPLIGSIDEEELKEIERDKK